MRRPPRTAADVTLHNAPPVAPQGRSVLRGRGRFGASRLHALFSVLRGASAPFAAQCPVSSPLTASAEKQAPTGDGRRSRRQVTPLLTRGSTGPGVHEVSPRQLPPARLVSHNLERNASTSLTSEERGEDGFAEIEQGPRVQTPGPLKGKVARILCRTPTHRGR